jgi:hypothetical protein
MILDSAVDRLLPLLMPSVLEPYCRLTGHRKGERATHPIARFLSRLALLLRLAWNGHAALSRLARRLKKRTLGRVQLRNLG